MCQPEVQFIPPAEPVYYRDIYLQSMRLHVLHEIRAGTKHDNTYGYLLCRILKASHATINLIFRISFMP